MAFQFLKQNGWAGLFNSRDARDIGNGLSKAQNISLDVGGKIRAIGGLTDFTKVDGSTALTQTAKIAPGSGLFRYGSDHWRGTDTIVDLLANSNATADQQTEADATTGWTAWSGAVLDSGDPVGDYGITDTPVSGSDYVMELDTAAGTSAGAKQSFTTVIGQRYKVHAFMYGKGTSTIMYLYIGTTSQGYEHFSIQDKNIGSWEELEGEFIATTTTTHIAVLYLDASGDEGYADDVYVTAISRRDLDTNWLALLDAPNAQIDLYDVNSNSFTAALLDFGTVSSYVATIDTINFPTNKTITDSTSQFLNQGIQAGDVRSSLSYRPAVLLSHCRCIQI